MQRNESSSARNTVKPGIRVEVTDGMAVGYVGKVKERWGRDWADDVSLWVVTFDGLIRQRVLRADYLKVLP